MRNQSALVTIAQFRDRENSLWCAQRYYPKGKRYPEYWIAYLSKVGTSESIPCASESQLWYEVNRLRQPDFFVSSNFSA